MTVFIAKLHKSWLPYLAPEPIRYRSHIQNSPSLQQPWALLHLLPPFPSSPSSRPGPHMLARGHSFLHRHSIASQTHPNPALDTKRVLVSDTPRPKGLPPHAMAWLKFTDTLLRTTKGRQPREADPDWGPNKHSMVWIWNHFSSWEWLPQSYNLPLRPWTCLESHPGSRFPGGQWRRLAADLGSSHPKSATLLSSFGNVCLCPGKENPWIPGAPSSLCTQITAPARQRQVPRGAGKPWERRVGGIRDPPLWTRVCFHTCPDQPRSWLLPAKGAYVARSPTL